MKNVEKSKILEYITTVAVPFVSEFVAKKHFRVNACFDFEDNEPIVAIASLETPNNHGKYFKPNFLDKIERRRKTMATQKLKDFQFEKALNDLEKLITKMESGKLSLEESLKNFEEGIGLIKQCQQTLTQAEQKVQVLIKKQGSFRSSQTT